MKTVKVNNHASSSKIFLISGNDEFAIKEKTREIIISLCGDDPESNSNLEVIIGDGDAKPEEILSTLLNALRTPPFLSADKIIWLRHFIHFEKAFSADSSAADGLTVFIKQGVPQDITLVIDGIDIDQRKSFFKACKTAGAEILFFRKADITAKDYVKGQGERIEEICAKAKKHIDYSALNFLVETIGSDSGRIKSELDKLCCYIGKNETITLADCKAICSRTPETMGWEFSNRMIERDIPGALSVIGDLLEQMRNQRGGGSQELAVLFNSIRSVQELVMTRCAMAELNLPNNIGKSFFYAIPPDLKEKHPNNMLLSANPFRAYKMCESARSFTDIELAEAIEELLNANRKLVSGGGDARIILENLVLKIAGRNSHSKI
jgi:DNA polymerase-3 subunit delta